MNSIQLIVTGEMEKKSLANALKNEFPNLKFCETQKWDGFTSASINEQSPHGERTTVGKLAAAMVAAADPGRKGKPADMVIAIDDLELVNFRQPKAVIEYFRKAVVRCVEERWQTLDRQNKCFEIVRERCSFHLFVPMTEAYFFGDPDALNRAGIQRLSKVSGNDMDVESFNAADDPDYLNTPMNSIYWAIEPSQRMRHPKKYLEYLCDPKGNCERKDRYKETHNGVKALGCINWKSVLYHPRYVRFLRSLFDDIADRFNISNSYSGECESLTRRGGVLRNI